MTEEELLQILREPNWQERLRVLPEEKLAEALETYAHLPFGQLHMLPDYASVMSYMSQLGWQLTVRYWGQRNHPRERAAALWEQRLSALLGS